MATGDQAVAAVPDPSAPFAPGAALTALDGLLDRGPDADAAWDAAWIACVTNSPRWHETARGEYLRVVGDRR